jgi:hypothetical protein
MGSQFNREDPTVALYSVSTRSTLRRRIGAAARAWLASGRHRAETAPHEDHEAVVTTRIPRRSLIVHQHLDDMTEALVPTSVLTVPAPRAPRHRVTAYPNAYRAR